MWTIMWIPDTGYCVRVCMAFRFDKVLCMNRYIMLNRVSGTVCPMLSVTVLCLRTLLRNCWRRTPDELYVGRGAFDVELAPYEINLLVLLLWLPVERPSNRSRFAPCRLRSCKNWPAPFPGPMYKATKPGLAMSVVYLMLYCTVVY